MSPSAITYGGGLIAASTTQLVSEAYASRIIIGRHTSSSFALSSADALVVSSQLEKKPMRRRKMTSAQRRRNAKKRPLDDTHDESHGGTGTTGDSRDDEMDADGDGDDGEITRGKRQRVNAKQRKSKAKQREVERVPPSFPDRVAEYNRKFESERETLPALVRDAKMLRRHIRTMSNDARNIRNVLRARKRLNTLRVRIKSIESATEQTLFAQRIAPLLTLYVKDGGRGVPSSVSSAAAAATAVAAADVGMSTQTSASHTQDALESVYTWRVKRMFEPDTVIPRFVQRELCKTCKVDMIQITDEAQLVCPVCNIGVSFINTTSDSLPYGDEVGIASHNYNGKPNFRKRLAHYRIGVPEVPDTVMVAVSNHFKRIHDTSQRIIASTELHDGLVALGLQSYIPVTDIIARRMNGEPIAKLNDDEFNRIVWRFEQIFDAYDIHKDPGRKNIMNLGYATHASIRMERWYHFMDCFSVPGTPEVVRKLDNVMMRIATYLRNKQHNYPGAPLWSFARTN